MVLLPHWTFCFVNLSQWGVQKFPMISSLSFLNTLITFWAFEFVGRRVEKTRYSPNYGGGGRAFPFLNDAPVWEKSREFSCFLGVISCHTNTAACSISYSPQANLLFPYTGRSAQWYFTVRTNTALPFCGWVNSPVCFSNLFSHPKSRWVTSLFCHGEIGWWGYLCLREITGWERGGLCSQGWGGRVVSFSEGRFSGISNTSSQVIIQKTFRCSWKLEKSPTKLDSKAGLFYRLSYFQKITNYFCSYACRYRNLI